MASIEERTRSGRTTWRVVWRENGQKQQQSFATPDAADYFKGRVEQSGGTWPGDYNRAAGQFTWRMESAAPTFRTFADRTITSRGRADARTRADYKRLLELHVYPVMGDKPLDQITRFDVAAVASKMREKDRSAKTIENVHAVLSSILRDAVADEHVRRNVAIGALPTLPDVKTEEMVFLTPAEFRQVADHIAPGPYRDLARLLFGTGLRWSEATALQVQDIDLLEGKVLHVRRAWKRRGGLFELGGPKTNRSRRTVALSAELVSMLAGYLMGREQTEFVFTTPQDRPIRHSNYYNRVWLPAVAKAQRCTAHQDADKPCTKCVGALTKRPGLHSLRHSHASVLIADKVSLPAIQRRLGHESIQTTIDRYGHLAPEHADEINAAVDRSLGAAVPQ